MGPAVYCVKQNTVSRLAFNIDLFNYHFSTWCYHILLCSLAWPFIFWFCLDTL